MADVLSPSLQRGWALAGLMQCQVLLALPALELLTGVRRILIHGVPRGVFIHPASCNPRVQSLGSAPPPSSSPWFERSLGLLLGAVLCPVDLAVELISVLRNRCTYIQMWPDVCWLQQLIYARTGCHEGCRKFIGVLTLGWNYCCCKWQLWKHRFKYSFSSLYGTE